MLNHLKKKLRDLYNAPAVMLLCFFVLSSYWLLNMQSTILQQGSEFREQLDENLPILFMQQDLLSISMLVLTLLMIGPKIERIYGSVKFILIYSISTGIGSWLLYFYSSEPVESISMISMGILIGVYFRLILKRHYLINVMNKVIFFSYVSTLIILNFWIGGSLNKYVAAGFISGFLLSLIIKPQIFRKLTMVRRRTSWVKSGMTILAMMLILYTFSLLDLTMLKKEFPRYMDTWAEQWENGFLNSKAKEKSTTDSSNNREQETPFTEAKPIMNKEDKLYNSILQAISEKKKRVKLSFLPKDSDEVFDTLQQVLNNHPEIFYFDHTKSTYWSNGVLELGYKYSKTEIEQMEKQLNDVALDVLSNMTSNQSEHDRVKIVHDYIVKNTAYDYDNYLANTLPDESYSIVGTLLKGTAVCDGYTKSVQFLLAKAGIESAYVTGTGNGENHAWNKVKIDGNWYNIDSTWNDPVPDRRNKVSYHYFLVTDKQLAKDHVWEQENLPVANDSMYMKARRAFFR